MAYPTDPYYDPQRPSWLPYWIDTFDEEAAKYGMYPDAGSEPLKREYPNPPMPPGPGVPENLPENPVDRESAQGAVDSTIFLTEWQRQNQQFFEDLNARLEAEKKANESKVPLWMWAAGAGLVVFMLARRD
jgi:hypothetical protein